MSQQRELAGLLEEVQASTEALAQLLYDFSDLEVSVADEMRRTSEQIAARLRRWPLRIVLLGEPRARRSILDAVLGAKVFADSEEPKRSVTVVRAADRLEYVAKLDDGILEEFSARLPDRAEAFGRALVQAEREEAEIGAVIEALAPQVEYWSAQLASMPPPTEPPPPPPPAPEKKRRGLIDLFRALVVWVASLFGAKPRALPELDPPPRALPTPSGAHDETATVRQRVREMNVALDQAQERLARARARVEQITADREHYEGERKHAFLEELRALGDANERGAKVIELRVEVPSPVLIPGFDLVSGADDALLDDADGCILLTDDRGDTKVDLSTAIEKLHPITPRALRGANVHELPRVLDRMAMDHPLVVGTRAIERAAPCIARAIENSSLAERTSRTRIDALERQRIMNPADFRSRSLARVEKASREAADEIARGAVSSLKEAIADLRKEWTTAINTAASRGAVEAVVKIVNEEAQMRVVHIVDAANGRIASELQRASDTMQTWLLEELRVRCEVVRRESMPERVGVLAEPIEELTFRPPLSSVLEKFERKRVDIGMGGAAAGGTLIVPGIGTAIGAFAGTFAGLFKGLDSLKRDCIQKLEVSLHMVERHLREQIDALPPRFACAIQASLEEALDQALARFERSITHLLDLERRTLATEQAKLQRLSELRSVLADHDARFKQLAKRAGEMARSMYAARK